MAAAFKDDAAAARRGRKAKVRLRVMAKRLVMPAAHHRGGDRLLGKALWAAERNRQSKAVEKKLPEHLYLNGSHDLNRGGSVRRVPGYAQQRVLILQNMKLFQ